MNKRQKFTIAAVAVSAALTGCNSMQPKSDMAQRLETVERENAELRRSLAASGGTVGQSGVPGTATTKRDLLPPNARPGECYARVVIPERYESRSENMLKNPASERIEVIPAEYAMVDEKVLVTEATTKKTVIPAEYKTVEERIMVEAQSEKARVIPATYKTVTERVLVSEASEKLVTKPAVYESVAEKVLVRDAHTVWKKGRGPIERIDDSTGEIMCLVKVPAEYKTVTKRKLVKPERTEKVTIPAEYRTVNKRVVDQPARTVTEKVPARYETLEVRKMVKPPQTIEEPIPAVYKTVKVRKVVSPAKARRVPIAAEYQTVNKRVKVADSRLEWRPILCETNTTPDVVSKLQSELRKAGYDPGPVDGLLGNSTMAAVSEYQKSQGLASGKLTMETLRKLEVL